MGRVVGGPADGLRIVTKSGGFGGAEALITIVRATHIQSPTRTLHR